MKNLTSKDHFNKYANIIKDNLIIHLHMPVRKRELIKAFNTDPNLNNIALSKWDSLGFGLNMSLSLGEKVCLLKSFEDFLTQIRNKRLFVEESNYGKRNKENILCGQLQALPTVECQK